MTASVRSALAGLAALLLAAAGPSGLVGVGPTDRRVAVPTDELPWRAVVRITSGVERSCTGVVFDPAHVATAAHCLRQPVTGAWARAETVHVLLGYGHGSYRQDARVSALRIMPGYTPVRGNAMLGLDAAILTLAAPLPYEDVVTPAAPHAGMAITLAGYGQDRIEQLTADPACHILALRWDPGQHPVLLHDCDATSGTSGGPLLTRAQSGTWHVVGLQVAARRNQAGGIAVPAQTWAKPDRGTQTTRPASP